MKLEWYEEDGCLGGQRGMTIDFDNKTIEKHTGEVTNITAEDIEDIQWVMSMNCGKILREINLINIRMNQKETIKKRIKNGYSMIEPLSEDLKIKYGRRMAVLSSKYMEINSINPEEYITPKAGGK